MLRPQAGKPWQSLWVPRYIGFIWPMLAVAAATLVMRLPTNWVRIPAITLLLAINLGVGSFRIFGQTEPPVDLMAADAFSAQDAAHHTIIWTHLMPSMQNPGSANLYGEPGQYYLQLLENTPTDPVEFRKTLIERQKDIPGWRNMPWNRDLPADVDQIILWTEYRANGESIGPDPVPHSPWKLQTNQWFQARDCWIWKDLDKYRRSVYSNDRLK